MHDIDSKIKINQLAILERKLRIANFGNFVLVLAIAAFFWNKSLNYFITGWVLFSFLLMIVRALFVYPRYRKAIINEENGAFWIKLFCFTLIINAVIWATALLVFLIFTDTSMLLAVMFAVFVLFSSSCSTLSSYMPAFFSHCGPVLLALTIYCFSYNSAELWAYGVTIITYFVISTALTVTSNRDTHALIRLQLEKQELVSELEIKNIAAEESRVLAEKSANEKNRFLAAASHDLRQPLHSAGLLLSSLKGKIVDGPVQQTLTHIEKSIQALNNSFSSLLDVSKLDAGVVEANFESISLSDLMQRMEREFRSHTELKNLKLVFSGASLAVYSDLILLERILRNLIGNAIKYTDKGGVEVTWWANSSNQIEIAVTDTGSGIAGNEQEHVFSEYYQIHNPERDHSKGFGLGLSIVNRLCKLLKGNIVLQSKEHVGSTFRLTLPQGELDAVVELATKRQQIINLENTTLLVLDDDLGVRQSMRTLLESWGCTVLTADSSETAITEINTSSQIPKLILADYRLRDNVTGVDVVAQIYEELNNEIPAIIITGDTSPERLKDAVASGYFYHHIASDCNFFCNRSPSASQQTSSFV